MENAEVPVPKGMETMLYAKHDGVNYVVMTVEHETAQVQIDRLRETVTNMPIRSDDVFIVGYPRCGNHWFFEVLHMILYQTSEYTKTSFYESMIEGMALDPQMFERQKSPRIMSTHARMSKLPTGVLDKKIKVIYVFRHPKDALVSTFKLFSEFSLPNVKFTGDWDDFFEAQMNGEFIWGNILDHFKDLEKFLEKHPDVPVFLRSFNVALYKSDEQIKKICEFLEKPADIAESIARATLFANMKAGTKEKFDKFSEKFVDKGKSGILSQGKSGNWKSVFTVAQSEVFDAEFEKKLGGTRIAKLLREQEAF